MEILPRSVLRVHETPRHSEVDQEKQTALEPNNQIFAAPLDRGDPLAFKLGRDFRGLEWTRQARVGDLDRLEATPDELRLESCPNGLDLRQLGHPLSLARRYAPAECPALAGPGRLRAKHGEDDRA